MAVGERIEERERAAAKERQRDAGREFGKGIASGNLPEAIVGDSRERVGQALGVSGITYEKAKAVVAISQPAGVS